MYLAANFAEKLAHHPNFGKMDKIPDVCFFFVLYFYSYYFLFFSLFFLFFFVLCSFLSSLQIPKKKRQILTETFKTIDDELIALARSEGWMNGSTGLLLSSLSPQPISQTKCLCFFVFFCVCFVCFVCLVCF